LPTIIHYGWTLQPIIQRIPNSAIYAFGFSLLVVVVSVLHNYNNLVDRKRIFDKPAFKKLDFYGRLDGIGSVVSELETFLLGRIENYFFRLNIIEPDLQKFKIEIIPLVDYTDNEELQKFLVKEHKFRKNLVLGKEIKVTEEELENEFLLLDKLKQLDNILTEYKAKPLDIDEDELDK